MKTILSLKSFRVQTTPVRAIAAVLRLFANPKRHVRGPRMSKLPGNGRKDSYAGEVFSPGNAVSACAAGAVELVTGANVALQNEVGAALSKAADEIYGDDGYITTSEDRGLAAFRRVAKRALKDLRAS